MTKRFKIKLSSIKPCRSKTPPCLSQKQTLSTPFSPSNSKSFDDFYPIVPEPSPTTPNNGHYSTARIVPIQTPSSHENTNIIDTKIKHHKKCEKNVKTTKAKEVDGGWLSGGDNDSIYSSNEFDYRLASINKEPDKEREESVTVVKRSVNPYEEFKGLMLEMIIEKEIYGVKDLEHLLQRFLSLNLVHHHGSIVEAFAEVWGNLFGKTPNSTHV